MATILAVNCLCCLAKGFSNALLPARLCRVAPPLPALPPFPPPPARLVGSSRVSWISAMLSFIDGLILKPPERDSFDESGSLREKRWLSHFCHIRWYKTVRLDLQQIWHYGQNTAFSIHFRFHCSCAGSWYQLGFIAAMRFTQQTTQLDVTQGVPLKWNTQVLLNRVVFLCSAGFCGNVA